MKEELSIKKLLLFKKNLLKSIIFFLLSIAYLTANDYTDSLYKAIDIYHGIPRIEARLELSYSFRKSDYESSTEQSGKAFIEALELGELGLQAKALYFYGLSAYHNDKLDTALVYFSNSAELYKQDENFAQLAKVLCMKGTNYLGVTGDQRMSVSLYNQALIYARKASDHKTMAMIYSQLSNIYRMNGAYQQAIEFIYKSKEHYDIIGFHEGSAWILYSIGRIYTTLNLYDEALGKFKQGLDEYLKLPESVSSLTGVAICNDELGLAYLELGDFESARKHNLEARKIYDKIDSDFGMSNAYKYLARIEHAFGDNRLALEYLDVSLRLKKKINDVLGFPGVYNLYGNILKQEKQYDAAIDSLAIGLIHATNNSQKNRIIRINGSLAEIYAETEDYDLAYMYRTNEIAIMDSIQQSKATRALTQLEDLYDLEIREDLIEKLEQEKKINEMNLRREIAVRNFLLIILTMTIVFAFFFLKLFSSNKKANKTLKRNQEELQELNAMKDKFTSIIAHDLKSPFNSILGFSSLLIKYSEKQDYAKVKEFSEYINQISNQTFALLENLLQWSRSQMGKIPYKPKAMDLRVCIKNAKDHMYSAATEKNIEIISKMSTIVAMVDENMIHTILQNILSNAIKYSYKGGKVYIDAHEEKGKLFIEIKDEGVGMAKEISDRLFRIDETISIDGTEGEKGTGLGLILSKEFVERHRGKIHVSSEEGEGSCFTVELPI